MTIDKILIFFSTLSLINCQDVYDNEFESYIENNRNLSIKREKRRLFYELFMLINLRYYCIFPLPRSPWYIMSILLCQSKQVSFTF